MSRQEKDLVDAVVKEVARTAGSADSAARQTAVATFTRALLRRMPVGSLASTPRHELASMTLGAFEFLDGRGTRPSAVRVFNPELDRDGYECRGAVVEVAVDDSPFLIDSVTGQIEAAGMSVARLLHPVVGIERDAGGAITAVLSARGAPRRESFQHYELDQPLGAEHAAKLETRLHSVLADVALAVRDFEPMQKSVDRLIEIARAGSARYGLDEIEETVAFLDWLRDLNFVFLGFREYEIIDTPAGRAVRAIPASGLGILTSVARSAFAEPVLMENLAPDLRARYEAGDLLVITKTNSMATVHRNSKMDYIGVRHVGADGSVIGEARLIGLFTSKAYMAEAASIPVLHRKLDQILAAEDLIEGSHDHKLVIQLFESFPKDELFSTPTNDIRRSIVGLLQQQEHQNVRLFVRRDLLHRSVSLLVVLPRDRFNAELRKRLQRLFVDRFEGSSVDYRLSLGETGAARIHFTVWVSGHVPEVPFEELEAEVVGLTRTWEDRISSLLTETYGESRARVLIDHWTTRFPDYYKTSTPLPIAAADIARLDELDEDSRRLVIGLQNEPGPGEQLTRISVYRLDGKLDLSSILPTLEALGLRVVEEVPTKLLGGNGHTYIHDFGVRGPGGTALDLAATRDRVADAITAVLEGRAESDSLDRIIISTRLSHEQLAILRAYRVYWRLVSPAFTVEYVNDAFAAHPDIAERLMDLFDARFDPTLEDGDLRAAEIREWILRRLDDVESLDQDRILRGFLGLITATVRTNAFLPARPSLSLKLKSAEVPDMPLPHPLFEIFVYAPDVEGVHLRGGLVARGGIRWSDRRQDYRTEVLGLMKAQMTKNAVIVPTGSKGGFIVRRPPEDPTTMREHVAAAYTTFIRGMLDVTDNLVGGRVVHPPGVKVLDGEDPYLVVAADKGTAALSDTANAISAEYGYWLGDAFASGGSAGYDHKALGITARGAWESVKRHFGELGIDVMREPFTVVGIGDMSGDVFGNGMLLSPFIKLVAAFDHRHIFLDPDPDPKTSFEERSRLFRLPGSSWADYTAESISAGGGVFPRSAKHIELSPRIQEVLGIAETSVPPNTLISAILRAPVDLLWNGGIGTYVKAAEESNEQVGDRTNDPVRVDGRQLRCRVVGEGGNLGFTQRGRIEYARRGGMIATDFIDNAGGVHTSDREVNLKILLGLAEERGELDRDGRDALVAEVADDVTDRVVYENYLQAQILSQELDVAALRLESYEDLMESLESRGILDRAIEHLPSPEEVQERVREGRGLTEPELAVLIAYAKRDLSEALLASALPDWEYFKTDLIEYFPKLVEERFGHLIPEHPLRRELISTIVANQVVDSSGITFVSRLVTELGVTPAEVVRAYRISRAVTGAGERWKAIEDLHNDLAPDIERELMEGVDWLVEDTARWYLTHARNATVQEEIGFAGAGFEELTEIIAEAGPQEWREEREGLVDDLIDKGVPPELARRHVYQAELVHAPDILEVAERTDRSVADVARVFFLVGQSSGIDWLEDHADTLVVTNRWQRLAVRAIRDDLLLLRRQLTERVMAESGSLPPDIAVGSYLDGRQDAGARLNRFMRTLARDGVTDTAGLIVAIRQIRSTIGS